MARHHVLSKVSNYWLIEERSKTFNEGFIPTILQAL